MQAVPLTTSDHFHIVLNLSTDKIANLSALFFVPYALMQIPNGIMLDCSGIKKILPISLFITLIGLLLFAFSYNDFTLAFSRILLGLGCSIAYVTGIYIAAKYFPVSALPFFIAVLESVGPIGTILASKPSEIFLIKYGWLTANMVIITITAVLLIASIILVKNLQPSKFPNNSNKLSFSQIKQISKNRNLICLFVYSFSTWLIIMSFAGFWLKDYLMIVYQYSELKTLNFIEIYWSSFLLFSIILGLMNESIDKLKRLIKILAITGLIVFTILAVPRIFHEVSLALIFIAGGISASGIIIAFSLVSVSVPNHLIGLAVAINNTFAILGAYLGDTLFGYMKHIHIYNKFVNIVSADQHYHIALLIYPTFALTALIAVILLGSKNSKMIME